MQAVLRSGQFDQAEKRLHQLMRLVGKPVPPKVLALYLRLQIARDRLSEARETIDQYYKPGNTAAKSIDMDLARLEFLLATGDPNIGKWIELIGQRHDLFARRRAEAISLAHLRSSESARIVDASMIAAQGQDWLRRGNPKRAGDLLAAAAGAEQDPDRAIARAIEAAAAFISATDKPAAAKVLSEIVQGKPTGKQAAQAHLQSAVLYASLQPVDTDHLERLLRTTIRQWPESAEAERAREWLIKLLRAQRRLPDAAKVACNLPAAKISQPRIDTAVKLWTQAFRKAKPDRLPELGVEMVSAFNPLIGQSPIALNSFHNAAAYWLDLDVLSQLNLPEDTDSYAGQLLSYRRSTNPAAIGMPPDEVRDDAIQRLMRDGRLDPARRKQNALTIQGWESSAADSMDHLERLLWLDEIDRAVAMADRLSSASSAPAKSLTDAARLLGSSKRPQTISAAIRLLDRLAAGVPKGGQAWHRAKLEAIELLSTTGRSQDAFKRARFVLLTSPPSDDALLRKYQAFAAP